MWGSDKYCEKVVRESRAVARALFQEVTCHYRQSIHVHSDLRTLCISTNHPRAPPSVHLADICTWAASCRAPAHGCEPQTSLTRSLRACMITLYFSFLKMFPSLGFWEDVLPCFLFVMECVTCILNLTCLRTKPFHLNYPSLPSKWFYPILVSARDHPRPFAAAVPWSFLTLSLCFLLNIHVLN